MLLRYSVLSRIHVYIKMINNGNRTEWSPIRSVIIREINGSPICLITSMITDQIGRHNKIRERKGRKRTGEGIDNSFTIRKKNLFKCN